MTAFEKRVARASQKIKRLPLLELKPFTLRDQGSTNFTHRIEKASRKIKDLIAEADTNALQEESCLP